MSKAVTTVKDAERWFAAGVKENQQFLESWKRARAHAINAGFYFVKAQSVCPEGEWEIFLAAREDQIKRRTVYFYMQLASAALDWARTEQPKLAGPKLQAFAVKQVMLMSPKPLVALLRDLRELRPFGEYDAVKYAQRKNGLGQIEFQFDAVIKPLDMLTHFGEPGYEFIYPEGVDEVQYIGEVKAKLRAALARVEEIERGGGIIET
jgi:hypothetical protein